MALTEEQKQAVVEVIGFGALAIFEDVGENFSPLCERYIVIGLSKHKESEGLTTLWLPILIEAKSISLLHFYLMLK